MEETKNTPKKSLRWLKISGIILASLVILGGIGYGTYYFMTSNNLEPAHAFSVTTISGGNFTLSEHQGKVVLLDFMSLTCGPCEEMMPELVNISKEFNDTLVIFSVDVDLSDNATDLQAYKDLFNATWDFALDTVGLATAFAVVTLPKTVIIDSEGYITFAEIGFSADMNLREKIQETIEGKATRINASLGGTMAVAFLAGILSFFSPCAFPMLPGYMAYNLDLLVKTEKKEEEMDEEDKDTKARVRRRVWRSLLWGGAAALGIFLFYMIIGLIVSFAGGAASNWEWVEYIIPVVGGLLIILGVLTFTPYSLDMSKIISPISNIGKRKKKIDLEDSEEEESKKRSRAFSEAPQLVQLFLYGITYALASIGCNFPILIGLVLGALQAGSFFNAIMIFLVYSIAMALLMIVITLLVGFSKDALINRLQASTKAVKIISGILLILAGGFLIGWFLWDRYKL
ncbi:MAG: redoxin domain-containing protein [Candidatus Heimdallarchaeota archaeon]|nr:redoxin domain-containing protein [Candidatus Heimdallarchaeota archaeon]MBY8995081.1 redoxin domain-containing protein [Candidatus Heimdallarchaeota archaeon]